MNISDNNLEHGAPDTSNPEKEARDRDVIIGRNQQLFIKNGTNNVLEQHLGKKVLSQSDVKRWRRIIATRIALASSFGAEFGMLIPPDTHAVFPEEIAELDNRPGNRPVLQLLEAVSGNPRVHYPLDILVRHKKTDFVCHSADSHWSSYGAFLAYQSFLGALPFKVKSISRDDVKVFDRFGSGDLGEKLSPPIKGKFTECVIRNPSAIRIWDNQVTNRGFMAYWRNRRSDLPRAVLFMDSYGWKLQRFLAESFSEMFVVHTPFFEWDPIETYKPDVIISEMAERFLIRPPKDLWDQTALEAAQTKLPGAHYPILEDLRSLPFPI